MSGKKKEKLNRRILINPGSSAYKILSWVKKKQSMVIKTQGSSFMGFSSKIRNCNIYLLGVS